MSCRHNLAIGTCIRCYPSNPFNRLVEERIDPGTESGYEPNLDGPGAATDDRPSIAELQRDAVAMCTVSSADTEHWTAAPGRVLEAAPLLLEIVAAALAADSTPCTCHGESHCDEECAAMRACRAFDVALAKVRP